MAVGAVGEQGVGSVQHDLEITSENSILHLPIRANILPTRYNIMMTDACSYLPVMVLYCNLPNISMMMIISNGTAQCHVINFNDFMPTRHSHSMLCV